MKASTMRPRELGPSGPSWFPGEFDGVVDSSHSCRPVDVRPVRNLLGCNMSFRQVGTDLVRCDEIELCIRPNSLSPFSHEAMNDQEERTVQCSLQ
jgi:hypothetical protein